MKTLRLYTLFLLVSVASVALAVTLPSHSFYGANRLYDMNEDVVETEAGTTFSRINLRLSTENSAWGDKCWNEASGDVYKCQDCCGLSLESAEEKSGQSEANDALFDACMDICDATSLPLGSALWLLPFAFAYGIYRRYKSKKVDL